MIARHNSQQEHPFNSNRLWVFSDNKFHFDLINSVISDVNLPTTDTTSSLNICFLVVVFVGVSVVVVVTYSKSFYNYCDL